ncbi:MAG: hypothetical protein IID61_14575 [SAR324 cluster bacterium]|nr:hypothetical protein [SAR324 cluster bacterium]
MADEPEFQRDIITVGYVVLANIQGQVDIQIQAEPLSRIFGQIGRANVAPHPNGYIVQLGPTNLLQVLGNRIQFKGATPEILYELYRNARDRAMAPFNARAASAFGINLEANYTFTGISRDNLLTRMRPGAFQQSVTLEGIRIKQTFGIQTDILNVTIEKSQINQDALYFNCNNHINQPNQHSYSLDQLVNEVAQMLTTVDQFASEVYQCGQNPV